MINLTINREIRMNEIEFQYNKTPTDVTLRKAVILTKPNNNYLTIDTTELNEEEYKELEEGLDTLQSNIDKAYKERTSWLQSSGFGSYFRSFNKDKMTQINN
jgi:hypothetical protein